MPEKNQKQTYLLYFFFSAVFFFFRLATAASVKSALLESCGKIMLQMKSKQGEAGMRYRRVE